MHRVIIADDAPFVRDEIAALVSGEYEVAASVEDGAAAVDAAVRTGPDVALLDISMPVLDGIEAARRIKRSCPQVLLIFVSDHQHKSYIEAAFDAGGAGYVLKANMQSDLLVAIRQVLSGREYRSPQVGHFTR